MAHTDDSDHLPETEDLPTELYARTAEHARTYLASLATADVAPIVSLDALRRRLGGPLPDDGEAPEDIIDGLVEATRGGLMGSAGGRFFGWVIGGSLPAALAADWLTSTWDQNAALYACSPAEAVIEEVCGQWLKSLLGLPSEASFGLVSGCQMAHVTALASARYRLLARRDWDVEAEGLFAAPPVRVLTSEHRHASLDRAVRLLGVGSRSVQTIGSRKDGRIDVSALRRSLGQSDAATVVVLQAGDINTGLFDPFAEAIAVAREHDAWVHVDGAFGLWAAASPKYRHLLDGVELADSWATDAHKWLNVPYDSGLVFVADHAAHRCAMSNRASYLVHAEDGGPRDQIDWNPEWSRRGRGVALYAALRSLGRTGLAELIERTSGHAATLVDRIGALPGVEILSRAHLNQGLVRFLAADGNHDYRTDRVVDAIQAEGTSWFGGTTWNGMRAMRVSVCNWQTTDNDVDRTVAAVSHLLDASAPKVG